MKYKTKDRGQEVLALQFSGTNIDEVLRFQKPGDPSLNFAVPALNQPFTYTAKDGFPRKCAPKDWLVRDWDGVLCVCAADTFDKVFERVLP